MWHMLVSCAISGVGEEEDRKQMHQAADAYNSGLVRAPTALATPPDGRRWQWQQIILPTGPIGFLGLLPGTPQFASSCSWVLARLLRWRRRCEAELRGVLRPGRVGGSLPLDQTNSRAAGICRRRRNRLDSLP
jgi:hypothetical protein